MKTISPYGTIEYRNKHGKYHREDGPAIIRITGTKAWFINGQLHREDGPAVIFPSGTKAYYVNGIQYTHEEWLYLTSIQYKWKDFCESN